MGDIYDEGIDYGWGDNTNMSDGVQSAVPIIPGRVNSFLASGELDPWGYAGNVQTAATPSGNYGSWEPGGSKETAAYNARATGSPTNQNPGNRATGGYALPNKELVFNNPYAKNYASMFNPATPPAFKAMPTLATPVYDEKRARQIGYEQAAPYIGQLKTVVNRAVSRALAMPTSPGQSLSLRNIMGETGSGIDKAQATGANYGRQAYGDIYRTSVDTANRQFATDTSATQYENQSLQNQWNMTYQAALQDWMRTQG